MIGNDYTFTQGDSPLLVSMPHVGLAVPDDIKNTFTESAHALLDTDWDVHHLYDFLPSLGVSCLRANYSRYVIDLNRSARGESLYPGQNVTELCPTSQFDLSAVYQKGSQPTAEQIDQRVAQYWQPYHRKIESELLRIKEKHGYALLWDAHSIASQVPRFFTGSLADFNWGNADGQTSDAALAERLQKAVLAQGGYSSVINGRFKGGYITRHYGQPDERIHAIQLELSQATYMDECLGSPHIAERSLEQNLEHDFQADNNSVSQYYQASKADSVKPLLQDLVKIMLEFKG